ncbi:hypothetical protein Afil01_15950 [Actinorhabdospora filicis]|uniref:Uncharacterized protein n=1 Tax=Actinorhabdospora filicis TaxID=1785913 RepID=A0A9W6SIA3_9ACTN|nr:hypothetical protein [Actinorhabdospora filicis]GLZ76788.1 hypothetical protein Afil01_15950 [Actinorhabdospora filicis]
MSGPEPVVAALLAAADAHEAAVAALTSWHGEAADGYRAVAALFAGELRAAAGALAAGDAGALRDKARDHREVAAFMLARAATVRAELTGG